MIKLLDNYKQTKNIIDYLNRPYDLLNDNRIKFIYSIGGSLFVLIFLWTFGPFGIVLFSDIIKLKLLSAFCIAGAIILIIHIYLLQKIIIKKFTIKTTIVWFALDELNDRV